MVLFLLILVVVLVLWVIASYNKLVRSRNLVDNAWSQIENQLQRRFSLIPNLVKTVEAFASHEKHLFEDIAKAKQGYVNAQSVGEKSDAAKDLSRSIGGLLALGEAYPELKSNENFMHLQDELKGTEDKIAFARQFYNDSVTRFNTLIDMFPTNIFANSFNMTKREYFELENSEARKDIDIKFNIQ